MVSALYSAMIGPGLITGCGRHAVFVGIKRYFCRASYTH